MCVSLLSVESLGIIHGRQQLPYVYNSRKLYYIYVVVYPIKLSKQKIIWIFNIIFSSFCLDLFFFFLMIEMFDCY